MIDFFRNTIIAVTVVLTSIYSSMASLRPQSHHPTPTPSSTTIIATASVSPKITSKPTNKPLGTQDSQDIKPKITPTPQPSVEPITIPSSNSTTNQPVANNTTVQTQIDYSSYKISLQNVLYSLQRRLGSIRAQADAVPQQTKDAIAVINNTITNTKNAEAEAINRQTIITANELAKRGITGSSILARQEIQNALKPIYASYEPMISQLNDKKNQIYADAENKIYQFAAQDKDLSNKMSVVQSLINKIESGSFSDSNIPLVLQASNY
ncbi:hypothetical protein KKE60_08470 [Patescibacteria group bacterium]|nr:hypothetical protein [Patescibacteria group bacterium]